MKKLLLLFIVFLVILSCYTVNISKLNKDTPYEIYLKEAQNATNLNDYNSAIKIYEKMIKNYKENEEIVIIGKYEIAFISYIKNKKDDAKKLFNEILNSKTNSPKWVKPLSRKILNKIEENN